MMMMMGSGRSDPALFPLDEDQRSRQGARGSMPRTRCPNCDVIIKVEKPREGGLVVCPGCGVELEIVSTDPLEVDFTEDWQNEWEDEY
jgi:lysine biosynthesis protein LysW